MKMQTYYFPPITCQMKKYFFNKLLLSFALVLMYCLPFKLQAQANLDSLKTIANNTSLSDKSRAKASHKLGYLYAYQDIDSSHHYLRKAYDLAERTGNDSLIVLTLHGIAAGFKFIANHDKSLMYYQKVLRKSEAMEQPYYLGQIYNGLGAVYDRKGDAVMGLKFMQKALKIFVSNHDTLGQASTHYSIASAMMIRGENVEAKAHFQIAKKLFKSLDRIEDVIFCNGSLATLLEKTNPEKALVIYEEVIHLADSIQAYAIAVRGYQEIGKLHKKQNNLVEAEKALLKSIQLFQDIGKKDGEMESYKELGEVYLARGDFRKSIDYCTTAKEFFAKGEYIWMNKGSCECLYKAHQGKKNYKKAFEYAQEFQMLSDSMWSEEKTKELTAAKLNFEFEKEKDLLILQKQMDEKILLTKNQQTKNVAFGIGAFALLTLGFFWNARRKNKIIVEQNTAISKQNDQLEQLNTTKDRIFAIIGHDLRKPAIAFRGITKKVNYLLKKEDYETLNILGEEIERDALALNKLTDNLLNWALVQRDVLPHDPKEVYLAPIVEEITTIFNGVAKDKKIELDFNIREDMQVFADANAIRTVVRNLLDNALKYTPSGGSVVIKAMEENGETKISVSDTGIGIPEEKIKDIFFLKKEKSAQGTAGEKGTGLGMHLVNELVNLNKGTIEVISQLNKGTTVEVFLPKRKLALG